MSDHDIIVGSGPTGISAAVARLSLGRKVILVDGGKTLQPDLASLRDNLASQSPEDWSRTDIDTFRKGQREAPPNTIRKFGSDFAIEPAEATLDAPTIALRSSRAAGGLSNLWGASVLPSVQSDIDDWPITIDDLSPHYKAVAEFMPISGKKDTLFAIYPDGIPTGSRQLTPPPQATEILRRAEAKADQLDIKIGASRNAAHTDCKNCGMCLHGCPWGYIYSASHTLNTLKSNPNFTYMPEKTVVQIEETDGRVRVKFEDGESLTGERLFLGAGVLETARILMASFQKLTTLTLRDSHHFFTPLLHSWRAPSDPEKTPHHTLTSMFAAFTLPEHSPRLIHSQLYTWNEKYAVEMKKKYGKSMGFLDPIFNTISKRLIVAQSFLHSDHSGKIQLTPGQNGKLTATHQANPSSEKLTALARKKIAQEFRKIGLFALSFAGHSGAPGSSFHVGGSLPMSQNPTGAQSDTLGRPAGLTRIHVIDASVMPSIPATTITYTAMANAHRIAINSDT